MMEGAAVWMLWATDWAGDSAFLVGTLSSRIHLACIHNHPGYEVLNPL